MTYYTSIENTTAVVDLDCGESNLTDVGLDACAIRDEKGYDKPAQLTIVYDPDADGINSQGDKGKVSGVGDDDDTAYIVIRAKDAGGAILFEGEVTKGDAITFGPGVGGTLESNTYIAVYEDAAAYAANNAPLQTIGLHTSCSAPIVIGESVGSVVVAGFGFDAGGALDTYGGIGGSGDAGVTYAIAGGADAALFNVDADTGEVSLIDAPDFENPQDQDANNVYDVIVSATNVDGTVTLKPLEVCVEDDCIKIAENTTGPIVDLDSGTGGNTDIGTDICAVRDKNVNGLGEDTTKPTEITLTLGDMLTSEINSTQGDKLEVGAVQPGDDGDGSYVIRVSNKDNPYDTSENYFNGTVQAGESFTFASATGGRNEFGSETRVHIFDNDGTFLQTINFHTSCSAPLVIGDQYGSVSLTGATVLGMDSGTAYEFGGTDAAGDEGVVYSIQDGPGSDLFTVNADGEVSFIDAPNFENPQGINGTNNYEVVVLATLDDGTVIKKPVEICVEDDCIKIAENTTGPIVDLDSGTGGNTDIGTDICAVRDKNVNGLGEDTTKPTEITLTLGDMLTSEINSTQGDKLEVGAVQPGDDGDGSYVIRVSNKDNPYDTSENYFNGTVQAGESFTFASATGGRNEFGSETRVHIFDNDGTFLQTINFHTSCSAPLVIGDQYGSVSLTGATVLGMDSGTAYEFGGTDAAGDEGVVYSIQDGPGSDLFTVNADGEVSFIDAPNFENPQGINGTNNYEVVVLATLDDGTVIKKPVEICVEDDCIKIAENTTGPIVDLDSGTGGNTDIGTDICAVRDKNVNGLGEDTTKPTEITLTLGDMLTSEINSTQGDKLEVGAVQPGDDGDGSYVIRVSNKDNPNDTSENYFNGTVQAGESFTFASATGGRNEFGSETRVHIFDNDGTFLQTINFHTSCSAPLVIGDQYGSVSLTGATVLGMDSGTAYEFGGTDAAGDEGVVYSIQDGPGSDLFTVNADGEVSFIDAPNFENPQGINGTNNYEVVVLATLDDGTVIKKPVEICVEDDCIKIAENTTGPIVDLDSGTGGNTDIGTDICAVRDKNVNGLGEDTTKPTEITLTLGDMLTSEINSTQGDKLEVGAVQPGDDGDGSYVIRVSNKDNPNDTSENYFNGTVQAGESFTFASATGGRNEFGSETRVHIFDNNGTFLQTINFHTSCSAPLVIGDQYGSVSLTGATVLGMDSGTAYEFGGTDAAGDEGVVYSIQDGPGSDLFTVNADGEVSFIDAPNFENPQGINGTNNYEVVVLATLDDGTVIKKPVEICVEDELDAVCVDENTSPQPILNINLKVACPVPGADQGTDICAVRDKNVNGLGEDTTKPTEITLTLGDMLTSEINSTQGDKLEVGAVQPGDDGDGSYVIRVSNKDNPNDTSENYFNGTVQAGESFTFASATGGRNEFGSETRVHIFDNNGAFLQTINFHTSCSAPLVIGDQYGSVSLTGATVLGKDSGTAYEFGGMTIIELGEGDITYSLSGADAALFDIDPETGEVTFKDAPDYENPQDVGLDNVYNVVVRAEAKIDPTCFTEKPVEICVEDVDEVGSLSGRYFCDTNDNDVDDGQATDPGVAGVLVTLLDAAGNTVATTTTSGAPGAEGSYSFGNLAQGTYSVVFTNQNGVLDGKALVNPNVGDDDAIDSDAIGNTDSSTIVGIVVNPGEDTPDNDAGAEYLPGSLSGRYFCDTNDNDVDDGQATDPGVAGVLVTLLDAAGNTVATTTTSGVAGAEGSYSFGNLAQGTYSVVFTNQNGVLDGKALVNPNVGDDDAIDSDAIGNTDSSTIVGIVVNPGEDTPDNDAGAEYLPGSLSGRYFCDTNDNDVDDGQVTDPGVAGVLVTLLDAAGNTVATTTTSGVAGAEGSYSFGNLAQGTYSVVFTNQNGVLDGKALVNPNVGDDDAIDSDAIGNTDSSTIVGIVVNPGEDTPDNDAGAEYLPGSLSGRYFCDTNDNDVDDGQVTDPGVAGVLVTLLDAAGNTVATTTTSGVAGAEGSYSFGNLAQGTYSVVFTNQNGVLDGKALVNPNVGDDDAIDSDAIGNTDSSTIVGIVVNPGEDTPDNDAGAEYLPGSLSGRYFCDTNDNDVDDGQVTDPGVAGVLVTLLDAAGNTVATTTTSGVAGAEGSYSFGNLAQGTYSVVFTNQNGVLDGKALVNPNVGDDDAIDSDAIGNTDSSTIVGIVVNPGEDTPDNDAGAEYLPGSLSGRYFCDTNDNDVDDGQVTDPGVAGVLVTLLDAAGNTVATTTTSGVAGAEGSYSFGNLAQGTYSVVFTNQNGVLDGKALVNPNVGDDDAIDSDAIGNTDSSTIVGIVVNPGEDTPDNDAGAEYLPGSLSGRYFCDTNDNDVDDGQVTDPGVAGVLVTLLDAAGNTVATTTTSGVAGAEGSYSFGNLAQGTYSVVFTNQNGVLDGKALVNPNVGDDDAIDSDAIGNTDSSTIVGIVVNPGEDTPDNDAGAEYLPGSLSGRYFCDTNDNDVDDGQVTDPGVAGVLVTLLDAAGNTVATTTTSGVAGAEGSYSFGNLAQGTYSVVFTNQNGVLDGKALVNPNVGDDDAIDSDAIGNTDSSTIVGIVVNPGEDTPDNDAGAEYLPGSLSGRYFCDTNDNDVDDGQVTDPGVAGVLVTLLDAAGNTVATTTTSGVAGAEGSYSFGNLAQGTYSVVFTNQNGVLNGKALVNPNVGDDDAIDSDAIGNTDSSTIVGIVVNPGEDTPDNDAGAEYIVPVPVDDQSVTCADEVKKVDLLSNDPAGLTVVSISFGTEIADEYGEKITLSSGATVTLNADGTVSYDGTLAYPDLEIGDTAIDSFSYSVSNGFAEASADVDIGICGATTTIASVQAVLPDQITFTIARISGSDPRDAYTVTLGDTGTLELDGAVIETAYCIDESATIPTATLITAKVYIGTAAEAADSSLVAAILADLDNINWMINQDFTSMDNGDGTGTNYTDAEVQAAIWGFTNDEFTFYDPAAGTVENAEEIFDLAVLNGDGFIAGSGDLVTLVLDPVSPASAEQPFLITVEQECLCDQDGFVFSFV